MINRIDYDDNKLVDDHVFLSVSFFLLKSERRKKKCVKMWLSIAFDPNNHSIELIDDQKIELNVNDDDDET